MTVGFPTVIGRRSTSVCGNTGKDPLPLLSTDSCHHHTTTIIIMFFQTWLSLSLSAWLRKQKLGIDGWICCWFVSFFRSELCVVIVLPPVGYRLGLESADGPIALAPRFDCFADELRACICKLPLCLRHPVFFGWDRELSWRQLTIESNSVATEQTTNVSVLFYGMRSFLHGTRKQGTLGTDSIKSNRNNGNRINLYKDNETNLPIGCLSIPWVFIVKVYSPHKISSLNCRRKILFVISFVFYHEIECYEGQWNIGLINVRQFFKMCVLHNLYASNNVFTIDLHNSNVSSILTVIWHTTAVSTNSLTGPMQLL